MNEETVLITGGAGFLGTALTQHLIEVEKKNVVCYSRDHYKHQQLRASLKHTKKKNLICEIGDVLEQDRLTSVMMVHKPTTVIIAHALKDVTACELYPQNAIDINIIGTCNVLKSISFIEKYIKNVCFISTDKATNPKNTYGFTKALCEKRMTSSLLNYHTNCKVVRYGNVWNSTGSIVPLLVNSIKLNKPFCLRHPDITRFSLTIDRAVETIMSAITWGEDDPIKNNTHVLIPKLKSFKITDLLHYFSNDYSVNSLQTITNASESPNFHTVEKIHEELLSKHEIYVENDDYYGIVTPYTIEFRDIKTGKTVSSKDYVMPYQELKEILDKIMESYQ